MLAISPRVQLRTDQIDAIASHPPNYNNRPDYTYRGTQGSDQALALLRRYKTTKPKRPWAMIFNTDPIDKPGQHWVALYAPEFEDTRIEIMDSFGTEHLKRVYPTDPLLAEILKHVNVVRMPRLQRSDTYVCGHYCLAYLYSRTRGASFSNFVNKFNKTKINNDTLVLKFVNKVMRFPSKNVGRTHRPLQTCLCERKCRRKKNKK